MREPEARVSFGPNGLIIVSKGLSCVSGNAAELQDFMRWIAWAIAREHAPPVPRTAPVDDLDV